MVRLSRSSPDYLFRTFKKCLPRNECFFLPCSDAMVSYLELLRMAAE
jgi:hypothetical protein